MMVIDFANLAHQYQLYQSEISERIQSVLKGADYILGAQVTELEDKLQIHSGVSHAITCSSGTDALLLAMMALGVEADDEVITTPFSFIATAESIALLHAKPVFVDIATQDFAIDVSQIEAVITKKTKAIIAVSLYGQPADLGAISALAKAHNIFVIVDGAQSFGATYRGITDSALGDVSCTSFFPAKPLGCYGDGGAVFTNNTALNEKIRMLRVHGQSARYQHKYIGMTGRLDTIQAAVLCAKLPYYASELKARDAVARQYNSALGEVVETPRVLPMRTSSWAQYTVCTSTRDALKQHLQHVGIPTAVHYPRPLHLQPCFSYLGYGIGDFPVAERRASEVLSLPMNAFLTDEQIAYIAYQVQEFFKV